jgi:hypothetical protein
MRYQVVVYISNSEVENRKFFTLNNAKNFINTYGDSCSKSIMVFLKDRLLDGNYKKVIDEEKKYG